VIANKAPANQPAVNEVYLVWDDEAMSMVGFLTLDLKASEIAFFLSPILGCFFDLLAILLGGKKGIIAKASGA